MPRNQIRLEFESKETFAGGKSFGNVGSYERLLGMASFAVDPDEKDVPFICDLEFAPRNSDGLVEFKTVLDIVKPVDLGRGNRKLLFDFSNRGGRGAFTRLNDGGGPDLSKESYAGNGFLNRHGYTVVTCPDGESGLVELDTRAFDLAMVDLGLPGISGLEVAHRLKLRWPATRVALMTGYGDRMGPEDANAKGVDFVLAKPFSLDQLRSVVDHALAQGPPAKS